VNSEFRFPGVFSTAPRGRQGASHKLFGGRFSGAARDSDYRAFELGSVVGSQICERLHEVWNQDGRARHWLFPPMSQPPRLPEPAERSRDHPRGLPLLPRTDRPAEPNLLSRKTWRSPHRDRIPTPRRQPNARIRLPASDSIERLAGEVAIIHRKLRPPDNLVVLMPFAGDYNDVARLGDLDGMCDCLPAIDDRVGIFAWNDACLDLFQDRGRILVRGLSLVTTVMSDRSLAVLAILGRLVVSRSPPHPNTVKMRSA